MAGYIIQFNGHKYSVGRGLKYSSITELAKFLKVDVADLKRLRSGENKRTFINEETKNSIEIDLRQKKPLILREFGVSRITNRQLLKQNSTIFRGDNIINIFSDVPEGTQLRIFIDANLFIKYSENWEPYRLRVNTISTTGENIENIIIQEAYKKLPNLTKEDEEKIIINREIIPSYEVFRYREDGQKADIKNMILREIKPNKIDNLYNNVIYEDKWKHCIHDYLTDLYKNRFSKKTIEKLNTTQDIYNFCVEKNIKMISYDISGKCIMSNYPSKNSGIKSVIFIAYNNHLYPLKNQFLEKVKPVINNIKIVENIQNIIIDILLKGRLISDVILDGSKIISFIDCNIKYIENTEYLTCLEILKSFGLADKIFDKISFISMGKILSELYIKENDNSNFINGEQFIKGGFNYFNENLKGDFKCVDFNKFYPSCLRDLRFLIKVDMVKDDVIIKDNIFDKELIEDHYLYIVKPNNSTILIPDTNIYSGEFLKYCIKEDIEFEILQKIKCDRVENHYTKFINDLYEKLEIKQFKTIMNCFIGQFEKSIKSTYSNFIKIVNNNELETINFNTQLYKKIIDDVNIVFETVEKTNIYNKRPIAIQLKDESRLKIYKLMKQLKLTDENIKSINTDSISYIGSDLDKKLIGTGLGQLKYIKYKDINAGFNYTNEDINLLYNPYINENILGLCYAGTGKTYKIINEIIPCLKGEYIKKDCYETIIPNKKVEGGFIVLSPSHRSLTDYIENNINCDVIQKYEYSGEIPKEHTIIIDEIGMVSIRGVHLILNWIYSGRRIIAYGDYTQLLPVMDKEELNSNIFLSKFSFRDDLKINYRNNFTEEEYNNIKLGQYDNIELIKKYRNM